ncbi:BON domain-containing protein [Hoeflea marina]|uniref:BON domain-containing protein n=1 Tax=Hoeflea marina TaxID=274592 RepID=A0A317PFS4_9HYPH|nr:BON domain-containing protein [Hoeflea marina]PWV98806.1 BON domain-containing protein [Hoeflea marina]
MKVWTRWFWPGLVATSLCAALALWFRADAIESDLKSRVLAALTADHPWALITLDGRDLTLSGVAPDAQAQAEAIAIAASTAGLRRLSNGSVLIGVAAPYLLSGEKTETGIHLTGFVPNDALRGVIGGEVSGILPGIPVRDDTKLARGAPPSLAALAGFGTRMLSYFTVGRFDISDDGISVRGMALSPDDHLAAMEAAASALPAGSRLTSLEITPATLAGDYRWSASADGGRVSLSGFSPDADGAAVARMVRAKFGAVTLDDALKPAVGAIRGFESVTSMLLQVLSRLDHGTVTVNGGAVRVEGEALTEAARIEIIRKLAEDLPAGYAGTATVSLRPVGDGDMTAAWCAGEIARLTDGNPIAFEPGEAGVSPDSFGQLDLISYSLRRCGNTLLEITAHPDAGSTDPGQAGRRAQALVAYLMESGIDPARLRVSDAAHAAGGGDAGAGGVGFAVIED